MTSYRKRADLPMVVIPGIGAVEDDRVLEGNLDLYVPGLLVVVTDAPVSVPAPAPVPAVVESDDGPDIEEDDETLDIAADAEETPKKRKNAKVKGGKA